MALPFIHRLESIFLTMDSRYGVLSNQYGFHCTGCEDNCCFTLFYHHTLLECLYLHTGYDHLESREKQSVKESAYQFTGYQQQVEAGQEEPFRHICPLNLNGRCRLYAYRPMICRLHGLPYELHRPDRKIIYGKGCQAFSLQCGERSHGALNRTPLYAAMAELESEVRKAFDFKEKLKLTIAQILLLFD